MYTVQTDYLCHISYLSILPWTHTHTHRCSLRHCGAGTTSWDVWVEYFIHCLNIIIILECVHVCVVAISGVALRMRAPEACKPGQCRCCWAPDRHSPPLKLGRCGRCWCFSLTSLAQTRGQGGAGENLKIQRGSHQGVMASALSSKSGMQIWWGELTTARMLWQ